MELVRAEGLEPSRALRPNGFSYHLRLSPPPFGVCGLDYPFTVALAVGAARLVSTPSRREHIVRPGLARDCHFRFPRLWAVLHRRFPERALKFSSSPLRLPVPPHPRGRSSAAVHDRATAGIAERYGQKGQHDIRSLFATEAPNPTTLFPRGL